MFAISHMINKNMLKYIIDMIWPNKTDYEINIEKHKKENHFLQNNIVNAFMFQNKNGFSTYNILFLSYKDESELYIIIFYESKNNYNFL